MSGAKFSRAHEDAKRYVDEHNVERLVTQMINETVTLKPQDPKGFMVRWLLEKCDKEQQKETGVKIVREAAERVVYPEVRDAEAWDRLNKPEEPDVTEDGPRPSVSTAAGDIGDLGSKEGSKRESRAGSIAGSKIASDKGSDKGSVKGSSAGGTAAAERI
mmetsp:Transcript_126443/g.224052  ORF Transcript_126443/g.224052 Transcript_126443/m.224052 type:complete len:160 (+) Transcript_126443:66-545(+)